MKEKTMPIISAIEKDDAVKVAALLQPTLVELINIALIGKQLHWTIVGRRFKEVHEHLDVVIEESRMLHDKIAEYITTIGEIPNGMPQAAADNVLVDMPVDYIEVETVLDIATELLKKTVENVRARIPQAELDPVAEDLLIETATVLSKQLWMVSAGR